MRCSISPYIGKRYKEEEEELWVLGPGVNKVSFRARPHHNVHCTLGERHKLLCNGKRNVWENMIVP
jgi:hypothetical protein